jgi:hypothetical protein
MTASAAQRRRSAHAAARVAKERRQKIFLVVLAVVVVGVLAWELPGLIKRLNGTSSSSVLAPAPAAAAVKPQALPRRFTASASDPFVTRPLYDGDSGIGPTTGRDPFSTPSEAASTPAVLPAAAETLPEQIVIGTPSGKGATHGWIVILASIPTRDGRGSANEFARAARGNGISPVSVLNSSNRRPLRGGYWVVYTGPVRTVGEAEQLAATIHSGGYSGAYVRELIVYR